MRDGGARRTSVNCGAAEFERHLLSSRKYRVPPILSLYTLIIGLVYCNPIPNLLNAAKWPFLFLLWPNGHSYSFCGLLAIPFLGYLSTIAFPTK